MLTFGALEITREEKEEHAAAVREALAIVRLGGKEPGRNVLAVYDQYIAGNIDRDTCFEEVRSAAARDVAEYRQKLDERYPD